jgi:TetR/AcrR family transcriptional regulator
MKKIYHKDTFDNISEEKRIRLIETSMKIFGQKGISNAKIEDIAKQMGISYGSIYTYFATKEDLIHTIITMGIEFQRKTFEQPSENLDTFSHIELVLNRAFNEGRENPEMMALWHEMSLPYNAQYSPHTAELYREGVLEWKAILKNGIAKGEIKKEIDVNVMAFVLDAITSQLLRAHMSEFQKTKFPLHFPEHSENPINEIITQIKKLLA